jgi:ribosomal-protein-alanine N-acetyltransferase
MAPDPAAGTPEAGGRYCGPLPHLPGRLCLLRELLPSDAVSIQRHADDPAVARNLFDGFPQPYTLQDAQAWCGGLWREPQFGRAWAIDVDGQAIGCIGITLQDGWARCNAAVGYWIGQAFWGRGIAGDALTRLTAWAWGHLPHVTRLYAPIFARNLASQRVAAKSGYVREAVLPMSIVKGGEVIDCVQYAAYRAQPAPAQP